MNTPIISLRDKNLPVYQPSIIFHSALDHDNVYVPRLPVILKDHSGQLAYLLTQEVRNLLGHINLSVEMLESLIEDNEEKMYLDVIMRNSKRINNLLNGYLTRRQLDKVHGNK